MGAILKLLFYAFVFFMIIGLLGRCYNWITGKDEEIAAQKAAQEKIEQQAIKEKRIADSLEKVRYDKLAADSSSFIYWHEKALKNENYKSLYYEYIAHAALRAGRTSAINYPQYATILLSKAVAYEQTQYKDSLLTSIAKNDILLDSVKFSMYEHTAQLHFSRGDTAMAYEVYSKAFDANLLPKRQTAKYANYLSDIGKDKKAIPYWQYLINLDSTNSSYKNNLGVCYSNINQINKAIEYFAMAALLGNETAKNNLANYDRYVDADGNIQKRVHLSYGYSSSRGSKGWGKSSRRGGWGRRRR